MHYEIQWNLYTRCTSRDIIKYETAFLISALRNVNPMVEASLSVSRKLRQ